MDKYNRRKKRYFSTHHKQRRRDQKYNNPGNRNKPGLVAGVVGNTGYYEEVVSGEYLNKLKGYRGRAIFDEMRRSDPQIRAVLVAITLAIRQAEFYVQPGSDKPKDKQIAETIRKNLFEEMTVTWDDVIRHCLLMLPFGFSILEKVWEFKEGLYKLRKLDPRLPQSILKWKYNREKRRLIGPVQVDTDGLEYLLPIEKLLVFTSEREGDNWEGISILRAAYKPWYLKNDFEKINAIKHDRHGVGIPIAKVPASVRAGTKEWDDTEAALESLYANEKSYLIQPEGYEFDLLGGANKAGTDTLSSIKYYDEMIARAMLAMFLNLGSTDTGSRALGMSFIEIFLRSLQAYADYICEIMTRFCLREYVDFNWKVTNYPALKVQQIKELDTGAIASLVSAGIITSDRELENTVRAFFRLPEKQEDEALPEKKAPPEEPVEQEAPVEKPVKQEPPDDSRAREPQGKKAPAEQEKSDETTPEEESGLKNSDAPGYRLKVKSSPEITIPDFMGIELKLNSSEKDLTTELLHLRDDQVLFIIEKLAEGKRIQDIAVPHKKEMYTVCMKAYKKQLKEGRRQIKEELALQKAGIKQTFAEPDDYQEYVDVMSEELMIKVEGASHKLLNMLAFLTLDLKKRGISGDDLREMLRGKAGEKISDRSWIDIAAGAVNKGWGAGRNIEINQNADDIEYCYYSSVLDVNTCRNCLALEGKEHKPGDPGFLTPNPDCLGGDRCRCMTIAVYSREFFDEETYEKG